MKNITIAGRIGKDSVLRDAGGNDVLGFSVAVDDGYGENKRTIWFDCSVWGKRAVSLAPHLKKGTAVAVSGDLSTREHDGKSYLTVRVAELTMQGGGQEKPARREQGGYDRDDRRTSAGSFSNDLSDDIPF